MVEGGEAGAQVLHLPEQIGEAMRHGARETCREMHQVLG